MRAPEREGHDAGALLWRVGRRLRRTLYAMPGDQPADHDLFLGIMDTPGLAALVVAEHNTAREGP